MSVTSFTIEKELSHQELVDETKKVLRGMEPGERMDIKVLYDTVKTTLGPKAKKIRQRVFQAVLRNYYDEINISSAKLDPKSEIETLMVSLVEW